MPTIIVEGNLRFTFPNGWQAIKYDGTKFYREKIETLGAELKAVDFIAIHPNKEINHLLLIEVKDFRGHSAENRKRQTSGELPKEVLQKCVHTLSVLYLASYTKNQDLATFGEHPLTPLGDYNLLQQRKIDLILFMEEDEIAAGNKMELENHKKRINDIEIKLKRIYNNTKVSPRVLNKNTLRERDGFTVDHILRPK